MMEMGLNPVSQSIPYADLRLVPDMRNIICLNCEFVNLLESSKPMCFLYTWKTCLHMSEKYQFKIKCKNFFKDYKDWYI